MNDPTEALHTVATSPWNPVASVVLLTVMYGAIFLRTVIVQQSRFEWCALQTMSLWLGIIALRETWLQELLGAVGINLAVVRLFAHACAVLSGSALVLISVAWTSGYKLNRAQWWRTGVLAYVPSVACIAIMAAISLPALQENAAIEEFASRVGLYGVVYAAMPIAGAIYAGSTAAIAGFGRSDHRLNVVIGAMAVLVATLSVLDHCSRVLTAFETSHTRAEDLQTALSDRAAATDWMLVIPTAIVLASLMPVVVVAIAQRLSVSPAERSLRDVRELWLALVSAFPQIRLSRTAELAAPDEDLHRTLIEIEDALLLVTKWMTSAEVAASTDEDRFRAVRNAIGRSDREPLRPAVVLPWSKDEGAIIRLARRSDMAWESYYAP